LSRNAFRYDTPASLAVLPVALRHSPSSWPNSSRNWLDGDVRITAAAGVLQCQCGEVGDDVISEVAS
jgi:hypothetical protein